MRAIVVVLGDFGRSPRMQYHALALADRCAAVDVVAYRGAAPLPAVSGHPRIRLHLTAPLSVPEALNLPRLAFVAYAGARTVAQGARLLWKMLMLGRPDVILVQNPPALPTLLICLIAARLRRSKLVIDWHNFSHSMLALRLGPASLAVRMLRFSELTLGRRADAHLCVSAALKTDLAERCAVRRAVVFRDRPAAAFSPTPRESRMELVRRCLGDKTTIGGGARPAIVVCPTGWTEDEDLSLLIDAAAAYDRLAQAGSHSETAPLPPLLVLITGRGPLRTRYEVMIRRMKLRAVAIHTLWLAPEEYASLIGSADLGVSCHRSASGLDLAMKVADMLGAGLPVCALDYGACLAEQLRHGENGLTFADSGQLAARFCELLQGFPQPTPLLQSLRDNVARSHHQRWHDAWQSEAAPVLGC